MRRCGIVLTGLILCTIAPVRGADLAILVQDAQGLPAADSVASLVPVGGAVPPIRAAASAAIDQRGLKFVPRVLPVQTGTAVEFPNSDQVRHQVYSFSATKTFELRLYKGKPAAPVDFEKPGIVVLGCNIHDWMLGYIYVVDTPYFAKADASGNLKLEHIPAGAYGLSIWNPRQKADVGLFVESIEIADAAQQRTVALQLDPPEPEPDPPSALEQKFRRYQNHADEP
jgi:plastocyanin